MHQSRSTKEPEGTTYVQTSPIWGNWTVVNITKMIQNVKIAIFK